jgi:hypothetical protein
VALDLPRPSRSAAPFVALALGALLFEADPRLPWLAGAVAAGCFAGAALVRAVRAQRELAAVRRTADRLIVHEAHRTNDASALVRWRSDELVCAAERLRLRRELEHVVADLDPRTLPSASPLRRPAARANEDALRRLAARLDQSRPVSARGIVLLRWLLRAPSSPLYSDDAETRLPQALTRVLGALEP